MFRRLSGEVENELTADTMARSIGIASALEPSAARTWLKGPLDPNMARALEATTLPTLILGGVVKEDRARVLEQWGEALKLPTAFGLVVGRPWLFPLDDDVEGVLDATIALIR